MKRKYRIQKSFEKGKAPSPDAIHMEVVKAAPSIIFQLIVEIYNLCLQGYELPTGKKSIITSILKKGTKDDCTNYCGLTVLSSIGRIFAKILKYRI